MRINRLRGSVWVRMRLSICSSDISILLLLLALAVVPHACEAQTPTITSVQDDSAENDRANPGYDALTLSPGDMVELQVFDTPELSTKLRVGESGFIDVPVAGPLFVAGLNPMQASSAVRELLRERQIMRDARVTILVTEYTSQGVSILGEVNKPGKYVLLGQHNLYDALSVAGGTTDKLGDTIVVTHKRDPSLPTRIFVNSKNFSAMEQTTRIQPGDVVFASRAQSIFVIGDVGHPGEFMVPFGRRLNVLNAVALANGLNHTAASSKASIIRQTDDQVLTVRVNLKKLLKNEEDDPVLQPGDILVIPRSGAKSFAEIVLPATTGAVAGAVSAALVYH
jgi:polysaccharide export outer membrane protein